LKPALGRELNGKRLWLQLRRDKRDGRMEIRIPKPY
jgi:hypothetical protein